MTTYECYYNDATNVAVVNDASDDIWVGREPDYELVVKDGQLTISDFQGVTLTIPSGTETKEQLVILFAALLGLRAQAAEY